MGSIYHSFSRVKVYQAKWWYWNENSSDNNWIQDELYALIDSSLIVSITLKTHCTVVVADNQLDTTNLSLDLQVKLNIMRF